jgi:hypothetical protein
VRTFGIGRNIVGNTSDGISGQSSSSSDEEATSSVMGAGRGVRGDSGSGGMGSGARPTTAGSGVLSAISASGVDIRDGPPDTWAAGSAIAGVGSGTATSRDSGSRSGSSSPKGSGTSSSIALAIVVLLSHVGCSVDGALEHIDHGQATTSGSKCDREDLSGHLTAPFGVTSSRGNECGKLPGSRYSAVDASLLMTQMLPLPCPG